MNQNAKATQTWGTVDWARIAPANKRWSFISLANISLLTYRFLVAAGIVVAIILLMNLDHRQLRTYNIISHRHNGTRSWDSKDSQVHSTVTPLLDWMTQDLFKKYAVYNPVCAIPNYPPFHIDVDPFVRLENEANHTSPPQITTVTLEDESYTLELLNTSYYRDISVGVMGCCYSEIYNDFDHITIDDCVTLDGKVTLNSSANFVRVTCKDNVTTLYENVHVLVPLKAEAHRKMDQIYDDLPDLQPLSVTIVGLSSVSRLHLLRSMPKTALHLEKNGWYEFRGYHKTDSSSSNGYGPALSGLSAKQLEATCHDQEGTTIDSCPWIWRNFSDKYYITAYGDDGEDSFNSHGKFTEQPTDYFVRPRMISQRAPAQDISTSCRDSLGRKEAMDYVLDFSAKFSSLYANYPKFSVFWLNSAGHDMNCPAKIDNTLVSYLDALASSGTLATTMVVFMSDHGSRRWDFRQTYMGFVEDSLPFLYIWLPAGYRERHPDKVQSLVRNQHMLTSPFDLYKTLMDVIGVNAVPAGCPTCVSLFEPVPWVRGCADAGIDETSCVCAEYEELSTNSTEAQRMALLVAAHVNLLAAKHSHHLAEGYKCAKLSIKHVISARRQTAQNSLYFGRVYVIQLITSPGDGIFEAAIQLNTLRVLSVTDFSPQDDRSHCMKFHGGKPWCTCERL